VVYASLLHFCSGICLPASLCTGCVRVCTGCVYGVCTGCYTLWKEGGIYRVYTSGCTSGCTTGVPQGVLLVYLRVYIGRTGVPQGVPQGVPRENRDNSAQRGFPALE